MTSANATTATATATAATSKGMTQSSWIEATVDMSQAMRPSPPVNLLQQVKNHRDWVSDEYVLRMARQKFGVFTSTLVTGAARSEQCLAKDFVCVQEPLGVFACLKHMVVHRCNESWQQLKKWIDLPDGESSLRCYKIMVGAIRGDFSEISHLFSSRHDCLPVTTTAINVA